MSSAIGSAAGCQSAGYGFEPRLTLLSRCSSTDRATDFESVGWGFDSLHRFHGGPYVEVTVSDAENMAAYIHYWLLSDTVYILRMHVEPEYRRRGIARALLESLGDNLCLEVRTTNTAALALYLGHGLRVLGRMPGYYRDGTDAYYMESRNAGVLIRLENGDDGNSVVQVRALCSPPWR